MRVFLPLVLIVAWSSEGRGFERDLTISIDPEKKDCFYQHAAEGQNIDIEYQVIDGGQGALDIDFTLMDPNGLVMATHRRRQSGTHSGRTHTSGDHRFCFSNRHSTYNHKTVYFDLIIEGDSAEDDDDEHTNQENGSRREVEDTVSHHIGSFDRSEEVFSPADPEWAASITEVIVRLQESLRSARRLQEAAARVANRDSHTAFNRLTRVTVCSTGQTAVMIIVGLLQVVMLRSLFDETSRVHQFMKKMPFFGS